MWQKIKKRFSFMEGNLIILTIRQVIGMFFLRMVQPYDSLLVLAVGGNSSQIGIINSLRPLAGLLMFPISGYLTDRTSRVKIIVLADLLSAVTMLFFVFAPSWKWIAVGVLIEGFMVFSLPTTSAITADSIEPSYRGIGIATMTTLSNGAAIFSPYIAASILMQFGDNIGMRLLYGMLGLKSVFSAALIYKKLEETSEVNYSNHMPKIVEILKDSYSDIPELLKNTPRSILALGVVVLLGLISNCIAGPFWVIYVTEIIGLSKIEWGLILLLETIFKVILTIPFGIVSDRIGRKKTLLGAVLVSLISLPTFIFANNYSGVLLIRLGAAIASALFIPASTALMVDYVPRNLRGRVMAALGRGSLLIGATSGSIGGPGLGYLFVIPMMLFSIIGGVIYEMSPVFPWYMVGVATIIQVLVVILFIHDPETIQT